MQWIWNLTEEEKKAQKKVRMTRWGYEIELDVPRTLNEVLNWK